MLRPALPLLLAWLMAMPAAHAFIINAYGDPDGDALEIARNSARWNANTRSLVESGERGLGGGLEFSVDASLCTALNFVDSSTCDDIRAMIVTAGGRWSEGNPAISFTDVTDLIPAARSAPGSAQRRSGAEINIFAVPRSELIEGLEDSTATTETYYLPLPPVSTNGTTLWEAEGTFTDATIDFATDKCYYLMEPVAPGICVSFAQILIHELGHALGLSHPEQETYWNLDTDGDPTNPVLMGCQPHLAPLAVSAAFDPNAIMISGQGHREWDSLMTYDDFAGRDFLYPVCTPEEREVAMATATPPSGRVPFNEGTPEIDMHIDVPSPLYPIASLIRNESGRVILDVTFAADGSITDAAIATTSGNARLDNAALDIVRNAPIDARIPGPAGSSRAELAWTLPLRPAYDIVTPPQPGAPQTGTVPDLLQLPQDQGLLSLPPASIVARESGVVALTVSIGADASVTGISVRETSGYAALDEAAIRLARAATYEAGSMDGMPVDATLDMAVAYTSYPVAPSPRCYSWPPNVTLPALRMAYFSAAAGPPPPPEADNPIAQLWVKAAADGSIETMLLSTDEGWMHVDEALREWWQPTAMIPADHPPQECWYYRPFLIPG